MDSPVCRMGIRVEACPRSAPGPTRTSVAAHIRRSLWRPLGTLAGADGGQDLGRSAARAGVDERGALLVVRGPADGDAGRAAARVVVERAVRHGAARHGNGNGRGVLLVPSVPLPRGRCLHDKPERQHK